jgi:predicted nucleic-acid-binding protein
LITEYNEEPKTVSVGTMIQDDTTGSFQSKTAKFMLQYSCKAYIADEVPVVLVLYLKKKKEEKVRITATHTGQQQKGDLTYRLLLLLGDFFGADP